MGSLAGKMYPPTLILFLLVNLASSVTIPTDNAKRYPTPRIVVLGTAGVGKSVFANALFNRDSHHKNPEKQCFEGGLVLNGKRGKTTEACIQTGYFLNDPNNGEITVVDTPGLGMDKLEELASTKTIVQKLKEVEYVHAFAMLYKEGDNRPSLERLTVLEHYTNIFGSDFLKNVIIVATHWGYDANSEHRRQENLKESGEKNWLEYQKKLSGFDKLKYGNDLEAIYFTPYNLVYEASLVNKSYENLEYLYNWALKKEPFHCRDIEVVLPQLLEQENKIRALEEKVKRLDELEQLKNKTKYLEADLKKCKEDATTEVNTSETEMIGLGLGCTVLGIILGFLAFRYYKMNANNANYNDDDLDDDDDLEKLGGNKETSCLENNQTEAETETEKYIDSTEDENLSMK